MSKIESLIKSNETNGFKFKPSRLFFQNIGIRQKRFWMIVRNEVDPTIPELKAIANHFGENFLDLIEN